MEVVSALISPIVEILMVPVKQHMSFAFSTTKHVRNMNNKIKQLDGISHDVKHHMETNKISNLDIPARVTGWLEDVGKIKEDAQSISSTGNICFNLKMRYRAGMKAFKITLEIEGLIKENFETIWTDAKKPLGKVNSQITSANSALSSGDAQNDFQSRDASFKEALMFLQQDHKGQVIALCGMGGVGKTTMMEQLKKTTEDKKMFDYVVKVVIGQQINGYSIQQTVAEYMGQSQSVTETSIAARADHLRLIFENLPEGKRRVLVILDDVWETIELKDIGLSPLPNGFKLLMTSRSENVCNNIAVEANSDLKLVRVDVMEELEAQNFFWKIIGVSNQHDQELNQIGSNIVRRCGFLPLAIKLIATTLKSQEAFVWRNTFQRLEKKNIDKNVQEIIDISFNYIKEEEEKAIFLLCGLFPDDFNIPIEELTRYAWGLQLLSDVPTLGDARDRTKTCVQNLKSANLLMDSDHIGYVKMHDLVLAFVLGRVSKGDHPWMINHGDTLNWSTTAVSESCKSISITCTGMSEFPRDLKYPSLSLLSLRCGDRALKFPEDFYEKMENLEVLAYEKMHYPLLPRSPQCSSKLKTLILNECNLLFDFSVIGEMLNLEVLSFARCGINNLPTAIGKLKKLKLLDLTGCENLRIDDGVLKNLVNLEELYMKVKRNNAIRFTNDNRAELAEISEHLSALEVEFFGNNGKPENMVFTKVERFRISMGRSLAEIEHSKKHSFENSLMLVTNKDDLLESKMNELFAKTEVLHLEVDGIYELEEVVVESVNLPRQSFNNLRVLKMSKCAKLRYLFTVPMANSLMKLETLSVSKCPVLEVLAKSETGGDAGVLKFQKLKYLSLESLPKLVGLCDIVNVVELPELVELDLGGLPNFTSIYAENTSAIQPFFNKEVLLPKLKILTIKMMNKLKDIWPYQFSNSDKIDPCMLRKIKVSECDNIVNLFPINPMLLLSHLEELDVSHCGSIELLFNIDISCLGEIEEYSSNLKRINVYKLGKLRELWRMKGESSSDILIRNFQAVERIMIEKCESFLNVFTPTVTNSNVNALMNLSIDGRRRPWEERQRNIESVQKSKEKNVISKIEISEVYGNTPDVESSTHPIPILSYLKVAGNKVVEVVFEIESSGSSRDLTTTQHNHQPILQLPYLKELNLYKMERMSHVWNCNWNKLVIPQNQSQSSFHNLTIIHMDGCNSIKYLFSPLMGKLLPNLKEIWIGECDDMEEVVSYRDIDENDEMATSIYIISFPHLEKLHLYGLPRLKSIDRGNYVRGRSNIASTSSSAVTTTSIHQFQCSQVGVASWFLHKNSKEIYISQCHALSIVFPSANMTFLQLSNLTILEIINCELLEYIFTSSILESLKQLKELTVEECKAMQVIVKEDGEHTETSKTISFPRLQSLILANLPILKGFFLGKDEFRWPLLENVTIDDCPQMTVFTSGQSMTPKLKYIRTGLGDHSLECGLNFHLTNVVDEETHLPAVTTPDKIKLLEFPWSFSNLVQLNTAEGPYYYFEKLLRSRIIFPWNELSNLKNLEKLSINNYLRHAEVEEVFEVVEEGIDDDNDDVNETQTQTQSSSVVEFEKLKEVTLRNLHNLRHMWKSNRWIVFNFPNLTKLEITLCRLLGHVFTSCMVGSLSQLQQLQIEGCDAMDVIVKDDDEVEEEDSSDETRPIQVVFPRLKSITLIDLPKLKGFWLSKEAFLWPSLDTLEIKKCPKIRVFTCGVSTTPELKQIDTTFGMCDAIQDPNTFIYNKLQQGWEF